MCKHQFLQLNDLRVCKRCGLTILPNRKAFYDQRLIQQHKEGKDEMDG